VPDQAEGGVAGTRRRRVVAAKASKEAMSMYDVLIAGWGPTGMVAANVLGRAGFSVAAFERYPALYPLPRVGGVADDVVRVFQELGFADEVQSHTYIPTTYEMIHDGEVIFASPLSPEAAHGWPQLTCLFQPFFEARLDRAARNVPSVDVFQNSTVVAVSQTADGVTLTIEDSFSKEQRRVEGRYLIGSDGGNSFVRTALGIESEHFGFEQDWLVVDAEIKRSRAGWPPLAQLCNPEQPGMAMQLGRHHRRCAFMILPGETKEEATEPQSVWRRLAALNGPAGATPDDVSLIRHASYRFTSLLARTWRAGRIFIAGDAAHQMPPYLGQGMTSGIRDAYNLAHHVALVLNGRASNDFLDTYELERKANCRSAIEESVRVGRVVNERDPIKVAKRDADLKAAQARSTSQLVGYRAPGLVRGFVGKRPTCRGGGEIFVQGTVERHGVCGRFDDVVGRGFMIMARAGNVGDALGEQDRAFWKSLGGDIVTFGDATRNGDCHISDSAGWYGRLMDEFGCDVLVKRSDFYIFGMYPTVADLPSALDDMRAQMRAG
jgi:2-polyprenyl-6-methoxyphenol hydroxylase-like FAD-dependent oxidoreductase